MGAALEDVTSGDTAHYVLKRRHVVGYRSHEHWKPSLPQVIWYREALNIFLGAA